MPIMKYTIFGAALMARLRGAICCGPLLPSIKQIGLMRPLYAHPGMRDLCIPNETVFVAAHLDAAT